MNDLMTLQEAADTLRLSTRQVREHIRRGDLFAYRIGSNGSLRIPAKSIEELLQPTTDHKAPAV